VCQKGKTEVLEKMEPTIRLELMTCRLRIVRIEGTRRNPNNLQSHSRTETHPM
jgi:hypothetical protein